MRKRYQYIIDAMSDLDIEHHGVAVDCACGMGQGLGALRDAGYEALGFDIKQGRVNICRQKGYTARKGDITHLEMPDDCADIYVSSETLEHLTRKQTKMAVKDMRRVCRSGGYIAITVPENKIRCLQSKHHKQFLSVDDLKKLFSNNEVVFHGVFYKVYPTRGSNVMIFRN